MKATFSQLKRKIETRKSKSKSTQSECLIFCHRWYFCFFSRLHCEICDSLNEQFPVNEMINESIRFLMWNEMKKNICTLLKFRELTNCECCYLIIYKLKEKNRRKVKTGFVYEMCFMCCFYCFLNCAAAAALSPSLIGWHSNRFHSDHL